VKLVSPLLKHVLYPGLSKAGYLRRVARTDAAVLTYHGVLPAGYKTIDPGLDGNLVSADSFRLQLRFLKSQYNVISPEEFLLCSEAGHDFPRRSVLLTCDDGLRNCFSDLLPILQEFELKCLFFVTGASLSPTPTILWHEELYLMFLASPESFRLELLGIGERMAASSQEKRSLWWELVRKLSQYNQNHRKTLLEGIRLQLGLSMQWDVEYCEDPVLSRRFLALDRSELHQIADAGMCIGAHTLSHPMLSQSAPDAAWREILESKRCLEQVLGQEVWAFAYPFGDSSSVSSRELQMAKQAGFTTAFLNGNQDFGTQTPRLALPRVHITAEMTLAELEAHISGFHQALQELFRPANFSAAIGSNS
jgi:peptidoglycan/xylan/chitin deacetylase (PgdA/CDA1 family)